MSSEKNNKFKMPMWMIILDGIGSLILGLGLAEYFANVGLVPEILKVDGYAIKIMIVGGVLYIPASLFFLKKLIGRNIHEI